MRVITFALLASCGGAKPMPAPIADPADAAKPPSGPESACVAGNCTDGKGVMTIGRGAARAIVDGTFAAGARVGDAVVYRVAGATYETLEIDAKTGTGTLRHPEFDVVGQITADPAPQLADPTAAVMLPTGEWFFAEWSPTAVAAKDSNLTGARRVPKLPDDYSDLLAGTFVLEEARRAGRTLKLRPPGEDDAPFVAPVALAPTNLVAFVPRTKEPIAYIVGVGVVDPDSPAIAALRAGKMPVGAVRILRAEGSALLEIRADGSFSAWPRWTTGAVDPLDKLPRALDRIEANRAAARTALRAGDLAAVDAELEAAVGTATRIRDAMPAQEAARIAKLDALVDAMAMSQARARLAAKLAALATTDAREVVADATGQVALDFDLRSLR